MSRRITPVTDNKDKKLTYSHNLKRYNKAMRDGFYFEAILISYAMMEDRLRSFLYHMGLSRTRGKQERCNRRMSVPIHGKGHHVRQ